MQFSIRRTARAAACTVLALTVLGAIAGPQDSTDTSSQELNAAAGSADAGTGINSRTMQILLDIQNSKPQTENASKPARPIEGPARAPVQIQESGALGSDRAPVTATKPKKDSIGLEALDQSLQWARPAANNTPATTENARARVISNGDPSPSLGTVDPDASGWLPTSVMHFVRQNREMVLLVCLLALGLAAFFTASATKKR